MVLMISLALPSGRWSIHTCRGTHMKTPGLLSDYPHLLLIHTSVLDHKVTPLVFLISNPKRCCQPKRWSQSQCALYYSTTRVRPIISRLFENALWTPRGAAKSRVLRPPTLHSNHSRPPPPSLLSPTEPADSVGPRIVRFATCLGREGVFCYLGPLFSKSSALKIQDSRSRMGAH